jgi:hypothetical protein
VSCDGQQQRWQPCTGQGLTQAVQQHICSQVLQHKTAACSQQHGRTIMQPEALKVSLVPHAAASVCNLALNATAHCDAALLLPRLLLTVPA